MLTTAQRLGARRLSLTTGGTDERTQAIRAVAAKLVCGRAVAPGDLDRLGPRRTGDSIRIGYDWNQGELRLDQPYTLAGGGVAVMEIGGAIIYRPNIFDVLFFGDLPTAMLVEALRRATADRQVRTLVLKMDTPGGSVNGCYEIAKALEEFKAGDGEGEKTLVAVAAESMCSLGVWVGCVADRAYITPTGIAGSVGTIILQYDDSKMFTELGVEPRPIATHPRKAQGHAGVPIDDALQDDTKAMVARHWAEFRARVANGRGLSEDDVEAMGARVFMGADAVEAGLIDEVVETFDGLIEELVAGGGVI